jgi:hypothetical protein
VRRSGVVGGSLSRHPAKAEQPRDVRACGVIGWVGFTMRRRARRRRLVHTSLGTSHTEPMEPCSQRRVEGHGWVCDAEFCWQRVRGVSKTHTARHTPQRAGEEGDAPLCCGKGLHYTCRCAAAIAFAVAAATSAAVGAMLTAGTSSCTASDARPTASQKSASSDSSAAALHPEEVPAAACPGAYAAGLQL